MGKETEDILYFASKGLCQACGLDKASQGFGIALVQKVVQNNFMGQALRNLHTAQTALISKVETANLQERLQVCGVGNEHIHA